jgi:hypothetical protein
MDKFIPFALAAVLLAALNPAYAADPPNGDAGNTAIHKNDGTSASPAVPGNTDQDRTARVIILGPGGLQDIPNPFANPAPRMLSDAWAMRT